MTAAQAQTNTRPVHELAASVEASLLRSLENGQLKVASIPEPVLRCLSHLRSSDFSLLRVARLIEEDALLTARVLWVSNSAAFAGLRRCRSILQAVTRLGATDLRLVLLEASAAPVFESRDPRIAGACRTMWQHARAVAMVAREIAIKVGLEDAGDAYLAGLLHDIGKPVVAAQLIEAEGRLMGKRTGIWLDPSVWISIVELAHRRIGIAIANRWMLPEVVLNAIARVGEYEPVMRSIVNCVRLANALVDAEGICVETVDAEANAEVVAQGRLLLGLDDPTTQQLREAVKRASRESFVV